MKDNEPKRYMVFSDFVKRMPLTRRIYSRYSFEELRRKTNDNPMAKLEMAIYNKHAERAEKRAIFYMIGFSLSTLYCTRQLFRYRMLTRIGRFGSIFGLGFSLFMIPYMMNIAKNGVIRRKIEKLEEKGEFEKAGELQRIFEKRRP